MSYNTPKIIPLEDIYFGVRVADRDITIPIKASRLPAIHYISTDFVVPVGQYAKIDIPKVYDAEIAFGVAVGGPIVSQVNATKDAAVELSVGVSIDAHCDHVCLVGTDMNIALTIEPALTQGHLASVNVAHDLISTAYITSNSEVPEISFGVGSGLDINAIAQNMPSTISLGVGVGMETETEKSRKRMLSDFENATLADLSDMTLQELYWIDVQ